MTQLFQAHSDGQQTQALSNLLPSGRVFASKNIDESNFRQLLKIFAPEMSRFEQAYLEVSKEHDINDADVYLESWEKALGIPDACFTATGDIDERRLHVIIKLACMNVSTEADMLNLATKLGHTITIEPLLQSAFPPYSIPMFPVGLPSARFIWIITGNNIGPSLPPYRIPHFLDIGAIILSCVLTKTKPAFVELRFVSAGEVPAVSSGFSNGFDFGFGG